MSHDHLCPVCREGFLEIDTDGPGTPYIVYCPACGTRFDHELLRDGANGLFEFIRLVEADQDPIAENWADDSKSFWECSQCHVRRKKSPGDPAFVYCPDCGKLVYSYY